jgi:hypothetical protein
MDNEGHQIINITDKSLYDVILAPQQLNRNDLAPYLVRKKIK